LVFAVPRRNLGEPRVPQVQRQTDSVSMDPVSVARTRIRKTHESCPCQLPHDGMFRAAPHQNDARHVSGLR
jgi:hypothetical protein